MEEKKEECWASTGFESVTSGSQAFSALPTEL